MGKGSNYIFLIKICELFAYILQEDKSQIKGTMMDNTEKASVQNMLKKGYSGGEAGPLTLRTDSRLGVWETEVGREMRNRSKELN